MPPGGPGGPPPLEPLLRMIAEHRPELARRLEELRARSPQQFREVLFQAVMSRLEVVLDEAERHPAPPERPEGGPGRPGMMEPPGPGGMGPGPGFAPGGAPGGPRPEPPPRMRELAERNERLEVRSHELARRIRELGPKAPAEERDGLRQELAGVVKEQFEIRTELRKAELEQIQHELQRLREMVEKMQSGLERRQKEAEAIIKERMEQLAGDEAAGW
jgi:hypothetical protein